MSQSICPNRTLPIEAATLLCAMRVWVAGQSRPAPALARIRLLLGRLEIAQAASHLDGLMFALRHGATRMLAVDCVCQPTVSEDEWTLLDALGLAQERRPFEALLLLRGLVTPEAARAALQSAAAIGSALARVGRFLPAPETEVRHFVLTAGSDAPIQGPVAPR